MELAGGGGGGGSISPCYALEVPLPSTHGVQQHQDYNLQAGFNMVLSRVPILSSTTAYNPSSNGWSIIDGDPRAGIEQNNISATGSEEGNSWWKSTGMEKGKMKIRRKMREPRFCFQTRSDHVDVLDDGYKWRKYGQKIVKNSLHPRSYFRCTHQNCRVKKRVERLSEDCRMVITTYEGRHAHAPPDDTTSSEHDQCFSSF